MWLFLFRNKSRGIKTYKPTKAKEEENDVHQHLEDGNWMDEQVTWHTKEI